MFLCVRVCVFPQDGDYLQFLKESNAEAVEEEERRYRFLAEKHCGLMKSVAILMTKVNYLKDETCTLCWLLKHLRRVQPLGEEIQW